MSAVAALRLVAVLTMFIGMRILDLKVDNCASLLIFSNIFTYLSSLIGQHVVQAINNGNYPGLAGNIVVLWQWASILSGAVASSFYLPANILLVLLLSFQCALSVTQPKKVEAEIVPHHHKIIEFYDVD